MLGIHLIMEFAPVSILIQISSFIVTFNSSGTIKIKKICEWWVLLTFTQESVLNVVFEFRVDLNDTYPRSLLQIAGLRVESQLNEIRVQSWLSGCSSDCKINWSLNLRLLLFHRRIVKNSTWELTRLLIWISEYSPFFLEVRGKRLQIRVSGFIEFKRECFNSKKR